MIRAMPIALALALLAAGFVMGSYGVGEAQPEVWSRPGDAVDDVPDADAALAWWQGLFGAASREPANLTEANDLLWIALGKMADDLMELDIKTRPLTKPDRPEFRIVAYVDADQPSNPQYEPSRSFNRLGSAPFVIHRQVGRYRIVVPGAGSPDGSRHGAVHISTIEPRGSLCQAVRWAGETDFLTVDVECVGTRGGAFGDREFVMTFSLLS